MIPKNEKSILALRSLLLDFLPVKLGEHMQEETILSVTHCPPFLHGFGEHGSVKFLVITLKPLTQLPS